MHNLNIKYKQLRLSIVGYYINIKFEIDSRLPATRDLYDQVRIYYKKHLMNDFKKPADHTIIMVNNKSALLKSNNDTYLPITQKVTKKTTKLYWYVSISIFDHVINTIILDNLPQKDGFLLHSSSFIVDDCAFCFLGPSGAGKSTVVKLLNNTYQALTEDSGVVVKHGMDYYLYQFNRTGKYKWLQENLRGYKIKAVFFLHKSTINKISQIQDKKNLQKKLHKQLFIAYGGPKEKNATDVFVHKNDCFYDMYFTRNQNMLKSLFEKFLKERKNT